MRGSCWSSFALFVSLFKMFSNRPRSRSHLPAWGLLNCELLMRPRLLAKKLNIQFPGNTFRRSSCGVLGGSVGKKSVIWTVSKMNLMKSHWQEQRQQQLPRAGEGYPVPVSRSFKRCVWASTEKSETCRMGARETEIGREREWGSQNLICGHVGVSKADNNDNLRSSRPSNQQPGTGDRQPRSRAAAPEARQQQGRQALSDHMATICRHTIKKGNKADITTKINDLGMPLPKNTQSTVEVFKLKNNYARRNLLKKFVWGDNVCQLIYFKVFLNHLKKMFGLNTKLYWTLKKEGQL